MWDLWWTKLHWGRFPPSTSASLVYFHFTDCSTFIIIIIIIRGWYNRSINGQRVECTTQQETKRKKHFSVQAKLETVSSKLHYFFQNKLQLLSLVSMIVFIVFK
jgi:hypothetical protein